MFEITEVGPLHHPIRDFELARDKNLQLILRTRTEPDSLSNAKPRIPGTVEINENKITFTSVSKMSVVASGVAPYSKNLTFSHNPAIHEGREESKLATLEATFNQVGSPRYTIDWLANVSEVFFYPDSTEMVVATEKIHSVAHGQSGLKLVASPKQTKSSRNCVAIVVDGIKLVLSKSEKEVAPLVTRPGFLLYDGVPSKEFRSKVRTCLSMAMGCYLVHLGHACFNDAWSMSSFQAVSAYSLGERAFSLSTSPPAPLGNQCMWELDGVLLSKLVNCFYDEYDNLRLNKLSWAYWHAVCATPHIAAVHFGAAIEALQRAYVKANLEKFSQQLLPEMRWQPLQRGLLSVVKEAGLDPEDTRMLQNKITGMNSTPASVTTQRLFSILHLQMSAAEEKAWKRRNTSAHGDLGDSETVAGIRELKLLRLRFLRLLLAMTKGSDRYYDYYSLGTPIRNIEDSIP